MIKINPSGQALVIYFDQKMNSSLVINALGLNRPWAPSLFYILSLMWDFQKGIICRGKYALFGLVWFGGHQNQLQRSPL